METRVNVIIPAALFSKSKQLVRKGYFSNFSELVREGLRKEIQQYKEVDIISEDERKLFLLLNKADQEGLLLDEKEMEKHGLKV